MVEKFVSVLKRTILVGYQTMNKFDDMSSCFDAVPATGRQMEGIAIAVEHIT